jgi:hypothetical protein
LTSRPQEPDWFSVTDTWIAVEVIELGAEETVVPEGGANVTTAPLWNPLPLMMIVCGELLIICGDGVIELITGSVSVIKLEMADQLPAPFEFFPWTSQKYWVSELSGIGGDHEVVPDAVLALNAQLVQEAAAAVPWGSPVELVAMRILYPEVAPVTAVQLKGVDAGMTPVAPAAGVRSVGAGKFELPEVVKLNMLDQIP